VQQQIAEVRTEIPEAVGRIRLLESQASLSVTRLY